MKRVQTYLLRLGQTTIGEEDGRIIILGLAAKGKAAIPRDAIPEESPILRRARAELEEYLAGRRRSFDLPLALHGTDFQRKVWQALTRIPYGETRSYKQIAEAVGCPRGYRAVGLANHRNPVSIVIPCHRVIGADGSLVGYGGGLPLKKALLRLEGSL